MSERREKFLRPKLKAFRIIAVPIVRGIGEVSRMSMFNVFVGLEQGRFEICCFRKSQYCRHAGPRAANCWISPQNIPRPPLHASP